MRSGSTMKEEELAQLLHEVVKRQSLALVNYAWSSDFRSLTLHRNPTYCELTYSNSGVGESYDLAAFQAEWPDVRVDLEVEGGCDSCGYGQQITMTFHATQFPWES